MWPLRAPLCQEATSAVTALTRPSPFLQYPVAFPDTGTGPSGELGRRWPTTFPPPSCLHPRRLGPSARRDPRRVRDNHRQSSASDRGQSRYRPKRGERASATTRVPRPRYRQRGPVTTNESSSRRESSIGRAASTAVTTSVSPARTPISVDVYTGATKVERLSQLAVVTPD